ncbi:MAG: sulfite exporter TauE/SafE family protein, partial [Deltaproteobacteria bacterium]
GETVGYLLSRAFGYLFMGAVMGHLGMGAMRLLPIPAIRGLALLLVGGGALWKGLSLLVPAFFHRIGRPARLRGLEVGWFLDRLPKRGIGLGLVTAILPCGMLMAAWMLAIATGDPLRGALVMLLFATASLPGLLLPLLLRRWIAWNFSPRAQGVAWCLLALWLMMRPFLGMFHASMHGGH